MLPGAHRVKAKGRVYWYAFRGGPQIWSGRAEDEEAAAPEIARAWLAERRQEPAVGTVAHVVRLYRMSPDLAALSPETRALYHPYLDEVETRFGDLSAREFGGLEGRSRLRKWRDELAERSPRSADQARAMVSRVASFGRERDLFPSDCEPAKDMKRLYVAPPQPPWPQEAIDKAMTGLPLHLSNVVAVALNTGLRRADLCALSWSHIDESAGLVRLWTSKGRKHRRMVTIPLTPALRASLARCPRVATTVLTTTAKRPWTPDGLANSLAAALDDLGISHRLHGLRRSAAVHLARQGLSSLQIARQLGWSESEAEAMSAIYVADDQLARK